MVGPFIFLDIDGVLNGHDPHANGYCGIDPGSMKILNYLLISTGAKIVVSSAWRYFVLRGEMNVAGFAGMMYTHGLKWGTLIDVLGPDIPDGNGGADRGAAIKEWFRTRYGLSHCCAHLAIDDLDLGYTLHKIRFLQTNPQYGLRGLGGPSVEEALNSLKGNTNSSPL